MKTREIVIAIMALIFAFILFRILGYFIGKIIEIVVILSLAYMIFLILKKLL